MAKTEKKSIDMDKVKDLVRSGICTDGAHHKTWYLGEIAKEIGLKLDDEEQEWLDENAIPP